MTSHPSAGPSTPAAERRLVSVLFADVVGSTSLAERLDPEEWRASVRRLTTAMRSAVDRYGGTVTSVMGDGVLAVFGAPVAHEDDPVRAIRAGLDMIEAIDGLAQDLAADLGERPAIRVGINTGLAIVEGLSPDGASIDALGDTVNVAARMQSAARVGTILVTGETWRYAAHAFTARSLGGIEVKGKGAPVAAWEIASLRDEVGTWRGIAGLTSPLVGRDRELERLASLVDAIHGGRGRAAVVLGEPGVGKSRLLAELRSRAIETGPGGTGWYEARGVSYGADTPYGLLAELARELIGVSLLASADPPSEVLADRLDPITAFADPLDRVAIARLLAIPVAADDAARLADLSPEALRGHFVAAVGAVLRAVGTDRPLVVVIEDAHWADDSSVEALEALLTAALDLPILFVIAARADRTVAGWRLAEAARQTFGAALTEISLSPLGPGETRAMIGHLLEVETLPEALRTFVLERGDGNPLFVEEIVRLLIERGWVTRQGERWVASGTAAEAEVPDNLRGLLLARIDQLPPEARQVLRVASVVGRDVPIGLLEDVADDAGGVSRALGLAEAAGLIRFAGVEPEPLYRFSHVLVQEAAYDSMLRSDRRALHRRIGEALLARYPERRDELAPTLGLHFERAGDRDRGVEFLLLAARRAMAAFARREARDLLDRAAALLVDAPEEPGADRLRVEVDTLRTVAGQDSIPFDESLRILADARSRAERLGDDRLVGSTLVLEARFRYGMGLIGPSADPAALASVLDRAIGIGRRIEAPEILAEPSAITGLLMAGRGDREGAIPVLEEAVDLLAGAEAGVAVDVQMASFYAGQLGVTAAELGRFDVAERMIRRGRDLAERSGDPNALADADIFEGMVLALQGRPEEARDMARLGAERAETIGNVICQTVGNWVAGEQELELGNTAPAIELLETASELAVYCRAFSVERMATASLVTARAITRASLEELHGLDRLLDQSRTAGDRLTEARILFQRGRANLVLAGGDPDRARTDLDAAAAIFAELGATPYLDQVERARATLSASP